MKEPTNEPRTLGTSLYQNSVQFSHSVVSDSLQHGLRHARLPYPSSTLQVCSNHVHWVGDIIQPSHLLSSPSLLPSIFPSIRVFPHDLVLRIRWPKYWSFNFSISPSKEYSGLIFFRIDWFDLLAVQGTLKSQFFFKCLDCKPLPFHTEGYERCFLLVKTLKKTTLFCDLLETLVSKWFHHIPPNTLINKLYTNILKTGKS